MSNDFDRILISKEQINERVNELAKQIDNDYAGKKPVFVCILKGSIMFYTDLLRAITIDSEMDFMSISSYGSGSTSGTLYMKKDLDLQIAGKDVIIVEDIIDSGKTLAHLKKILLERKPASLKIITLLDKPSRRVVDMQSDYVGFEIEDEFVVGYGLITIKIIERLTKSISCRVRYTKNKN